MGKREDFKALVDKSISEINIPNITTIGDYAFNSCSSLSNVTIPNGVIQIGNRAFEKCSSLKEIIIPSSVTSIGDFCFANTTSSLGLSTITFKQPSGMTVSLPTAGSSSGLFYCKTASNLTVYTDNETIKNYSYSSDNITAKIYHLDGSAWA